MVCNKRNLPINIDKKYLYLMKFECYARAEDYPIAE